LNGEIAPLLNEASDQLNSEAFGVSANGSVIVGAQSHQAGHREAFRWTAESGMIGLGFLPGHTTSSAYAVSADGSVVVGCSSNFATITAFRWTEETGMVALGRLEEMNEDSMAYAISSDGAIVVGCLSDHRGQDAVVWDSEHGIRRVRELLPPEFDKFEGAERRWRLNMATAVSADGNVVAGVGINPLGNREAWVARLNSGQLELENTARQQKHPGARAGVSKMKLVYGLTREPSNIKPAMVSPTL
jgi:probable HAF family extracellular repeat protein